MKFVLVTFLSISILMTAKGQSEEDIKRALELAFTCQNANNARSGEIVLPGEYVYDETKKIIGQKYLSGSFPDRYIISNEGIMEPQFFDAKLQTVLNSMGCSGKSHVEVDFVPTYNDQKQISRLERKTWYSNGKGGLNKPAWQLEYKEGKLVKVSKFKMISEGKNVLNALPLFDFLESETVIEWKDDGMILFTVNEYQSKKTKKDIQKVTRTTRYELQITKGKTITKRGNTTITFEANPDQVSKTYLDPTNAKKLITIFDLNKSGVVEKVTSSEFKNDVLDRKVVSSIEYISDSSNKDICQNKTKEKTQIFNSQNELIEERENNQVRVKNPDGTWGPWQSFRY